MSADQPISPESAMLGACAKAGLDPRHARLLHHYSNAIFYLPAENAVARVTTGMGASARVRLTHELTSWLVDEHHFPATRPLPSVEPVGITDGTVVSFWIYYPQPESPTPMTSVDLAILLRRLHQIESPHLPIPAWVPLVSLHDTVHDPVLSASLASDERQWVKTAITKVREELDRADWPLGIGLIHGDAWAGNLLHHTTGGTPAILGDWDWASVGPREVDLIPTWHAANRYGKGAGWTRDFINNYGYDLARWDGFSMLMAMRDLVQLTGPIRRAGDSPKHAAVLRQRLDALMAGDTTSPWIAL